MKNELNKINDESQKLKWLEYEKNSDLWAKELTQKTELSKGMTNTEIDEKQAYYFNLGKLAKDEFFQELDLFENYDFMPADLKNLYENWEDKIAVGLSYKECEKFLLECEFINYSFDYGLDANPIYLRPVDQDEQIRLHNLINATSIEITPEILNQLPNIIDGINISKIQKEILINNGSVAIASPNQEDELLVRFSLTNDGKINAQYPSGEERSIRILDILDLKEEEKEKINELKIGRLAVVNHEADQFKGEIFKINGENVTLLSLYGEARDFHKDRIYQFFPGQKYDIHEIEKLFKVKPAGIKFSDLEKSDINRLMKGELTNTLFKGVNNNDGQKLEYSFKMRPEFSKSQNKLTLKPYFKSKKEEFPATAYGTQLTSKQSEEVSKGKSIIVEGISKEQKPFTVKVHYDKDLNSFIADKFINKNESKQNEKLTDDNLYKHYKIDGRIDIDDNLVQKGNKVQKI